MSMNKVIGGVATTLLGVFILFGCASVPKGVPLSEKARGERAREGIPYYLPKPYLVVTRNFVKPADKKETASAPKPPPASGATNSVISSTTVTVATNVSQSEAAKKPAAPTNAAKKPEKKPANTYAWQIVYLPDMDMKYGLKFSKGTGTFDHSVNLKDGWMLTGINSKGDTQTDEMIGAVGEAAGSILGAVADIKTAGIALDAGSTNATTKQAFSNLLDSTNDDVVKAAIEEALKKYFENKEVPAGIWIYEISTKEGMNLRKVYEQIL